MEADGHLERSAVIRIEARRTWKDQASPNPKYNRVAPGGTWNRCGLPVADWIVSALPSPRAPIYASEKWGAP